MKEDFAKCSTNLMIERLSFDWIFREITSSVGYSLKILVAFWSFRACSNYVCDSSIYVIRYNVSQIAGLSSAAEFFVLLIFVYCAKKLAIWQETREEKV